MASVFRGGRAEQVVSGGVSQGPQARYLPIAEHGLIGDLHTVALVGTDGTIDWYCCPRFDSPSVFAAILDADRGGLFRISPDCEGWSSKQLYLPDTNVLITRFLMPDGVAEVQDFMPPRTDEPARRHRMIRRVLAVRGHMRFVVDVAPRFDYAPHATRSRLPSTARSSVLGRWDCSCLTPAQYHHAGVRPPRQRRPSPRGPSRRERRKSLNRRQRRGLPRDPRGSGELRRGWRRPGNDAEPTTRPTRCQSPQSQRPSVGSSRWASDPKCVAGVPTVGHPGEGLGDLAQLLGHLTPLVRVQCGHFIEQCRGRHLCVGHSSSLAVDADQITCGPPLACRRARSHGQVIRAHTMRTSVVAVSRYTGHGPNTSSRDAVAGFPLRKP